MARFIDKKITENEVAWDYIHLALSSSSTMTILQLQDLLALDDGCRTNDPISYVKGKDISLNWSWRLSSFSKLKKIGRQLSEKTQLFNR